MSGEFEWLGMQILRSTVLLCLIFAGYFLGRRMSASLRHAWLGWGLITLMPLWILPPLVPTWWNVTSTRIAGHRLTPTSSTIRDLSAEAGGSGLSSLQPPPKSDPERERIAPLVVSDLHQNEDADKIHFDILSAMPGTGSIMRDSSPAEEKSQPAIWIVAIWGIGWLIVSWRIGISHFRAFRFVSQANGSVDPRAEKMVAKMARQWKLWRKPDIRVAEVSCMPVAVGLRSPTIVLPPNVESWTYARLDTVLRHEMEHFRRKDLVIDLLARIGVSLYWFHPLAWLALRSLHCEQEKACDDAVVHGGLRPLDYADELKSLAIDALKSQSAGLAALDVVSRGTLEDRIESLLDVQIVRGHRPITRGTVLTLSSLAMVFAVGLSGMKASESNAVLPLSIGTSPGPIVPPLARPSRLGPPSVLEPPNRQDRPPIERYLVITNEDGDRIAGARVEVRGIGTGRFEDGTQASWALPAGQIESTFFSDEVGEVRIHFTADQLRGIPEEAGSVHYLALSVEHPDYVALMLDNFMLNAPEEVTLARGISISVTALDLKKQPLKSGLHVLASGFPSPRWILRDDGQLKSPILGTGPESSGRAFRIVYLPPDFGPLLFGPMTDVTSLQPVKDQVRLSVPLEAGVNLSGKLSTEEGSLPSSVSGVVFASVYDEADTEWLAWHDVALIESDGSFRFTSLPPNSTVELTGLIEGWHSNPTQESLRAFDLQHQTQYQYRQNSPGPGLMASPVHVGTQALETTLHMTRSGTLEIEVLDKEGLPLPNAIVSTSRFSVTRSGTTDFRTFERSVTSLDREWANRQPARPLPPFSWTRLTMQDGRVLLSNLMGGPQIVEVDLAGYAAETNFEGAPGVRLNVVDVDPKGSNYLQLTMIPNEESPETLDMLPTTEEGNRILMIHVFDDNGIPTQGVEVVLRQQNITNRTVEAWPDEWHWKCDEVGPGELALQFSIPDSLLGRKLQDLKLWIDVMKDGVGLSSRHEIGLFNPQPIQIR